MILVFLFFLIIVGTYLTIKFLSETKGRNYLALYLLSIVGIAINQVLSYHIYIIETFPIFNAFFGFLLAPLLYFHLLSLFSVKNHRKLHKIQVWISSPLIVFIIFWIFDDYRRKILDINTNSLATILISIQCLVYIALLYRFLTGQKHNIRKIKTTLQYQRIIWAIGIYIAFLTSIIFIVLENLFISPIYTHELVLIIFGINVLIVLFIMIKYLKNPIFFTKTDTSSFSTFTSEPQLSHLIKPSDQELIVKLEALIKTEKKFKDPGISLQSLSDVLDTPSHNLSKLINSYYQKSFYDYINSYRLFEVKEILSNPDLDDLRINEIMYKVGFASKSSFNTWFKKHTGMSPTKYRKNH